MDEEDTDEGDVVGVAGVKRGEDGVRPGVALV